MAEEPSAFVYTQKLLSYVEYDLYVNASFHTEEGALWDQQAQWTFPKSHPDYQNMIAPYIPANKPQIPLEKTTKSCFKWNPDLHKALQEYDIEEVHIVGYDIYDCVFATAQEAFDLGYFTYVIEECASTDNGKNLRDGMVSIMRELCMTNNSVVEETWFKTVA